jgi:hypothetical protein
MFWLVAYTSTSFIHDMMWSKLSRRLTSYTGLPLSTMVDRFTQTLLVMKKERARGHTKDHAVSSAVVARCQGAETLLARSVLRTQNQPLESTHEGFSQMMMSKRVGNKSQKDEWAALCLSHPDGELDKIAVAVERLWLKVDACGGPVNTTRDTETGPIIV